MQPKVGIGILVLHEGKILQGKRRNAHGEGSWGFPGGHLEFGETVAECTRRELLEETGLLAETVVEGPWKEIFFTAENKHYLNIFIFVTRFSGVLENKEAEKTEKWEWFNIKSLPSPLFEPIKKIAIHNSLEFFLKEHLLKQPQVAYLSAPYSHPDPQVCKERLALITEVAGKCIEEGNYVFSPLTHNIPIKELGNITSWEEWRDYDLTMLSLCNKMILLQLPGWEQSLGVQAEIAFAREKNIPIVEMKLEAMV